MTRKSLKAAAGGVTAFAVMSFGALVAEIIKDRSLLAVMGVAYPIALAVGMLAWAALMNAARPGEGTAVGLAAASRFGGLALLWALCLMLVWMMG